MIDVVIIILIGLAIIFKKKYSKRLIRKHLEPEDINESFEKIYNKIDKSQIEQLEKTRKILIILQVVLLLSIIIPIIMLLIIPIFQISSNKVMLKGDVINKIEIVVIIVIISISSIYRGKKNKYKKNYKKIIISSIVKAVNPNLQYANESNPYISKEAYDSAGFDNKEYNTYICDDCIEGVLENSNIRIEDIQAKLIISTRKTMSVTTMFEGIFVDADCNKNIQNTIKIVRNKVSLNKVKMDSSEFEKYFDVFTEDRVLAMRILTHDVMETLVNFYDKVKYEIVIKENKIYLRFFTGIMFEPKIYGKVQDKVLITTYYSILNFIVDVTNKINKEIQNLEI